jgi:hypothetical protein
MTKKHILKPGRHQFAPGSHAAHNNNNLSDAEAEWYLEKYPHIASMFITKPKAAKACRVSVGEKPVRSKKKKNEDLPTTN